MAKAKRKLSTKRKPSTKHKSNDTLHMLIVEARYYDNYSDELLRGAMRVLDEAAAQVDLITVPGALEIPAAVMMALDAAESQRRSYDAVIALGCVIQGETYHFEIVSNESARGIMDISISARIPIANGVLTVDTEDQAKARLGGSAGHKGEDAARAALTMVRLKHKLAEH